MKQAWQIWIDTGGTFTDGIAYAPAQLENPLRVKVLSSGELRAELTEQATSHRFRIRLPAAWQENDLLVGYEMSLLGATGKSTIVVLSDGWVTLADELAVTLPVTVSISAGEEAPVLATRLLTRTPLNKPFPLVQLRLGTTKGTNALLEKKGVKVALLTTSGFTDLAYIGHQQRPNLFQLNIPEPDLYYHQVIGVDERLDAQGQVIRALDEATIKVIIQQLDPEVEAIAIALLHAYRNPVHEVQLANALREAGYQYISYSYALSPTVKLLVRTQTTLVNAYLAPVIERYLERIQDSIFGKDTIGSRFLVMGSSGSLRTAAHFHPKDSLLSGPAGGIVGAASVAQQMGIEKILTLDMGGTSTDVAHYAGQFDYRFVVRVGGAEVLTPGLAISTVAAGGGSICTIEEGKLIVGPESAGAQPGPACYGAGGPLTITDVNLLLDKIDPAGLSVPLSRTAAITALQEVKSKLLAQTGQVYSDANLLSGFEQIANEKMAAAIREISIRKGFDPREYALLAFGGAGGLHACAIAELLGVQKVILPRDAGLLSAYGMGQAAIERMAEQQVLVPLTEIEGQLNSIIAQLHQTASAVLRSENLGEPLASPERVLLYLRFRGQDTPLEIRYQSGLDIGQAFTNLYHQQFGYLPEDAIVELESIKVFAALPKAATSTSERPNQYNTPVATPWYWETLPTGTQLQGGGVLVGQQATAYLPTHWEGRVWAGGHVLLSQLPKAAKQSGIWGEAIELELFTHRFSAIAEAMGTQLQRTAFSVNIKERLDFSCALLDAQGYLLVNAPHVPVHLGSLGVCARQCLVHTPIGPGDVLVVNHPAYGGSHLPDITLLQGVFTDAGECVGYVINRAHHAEIGGSRPGSMPPNATSLEEEGVVFAPTHLLKAGVSQWKAISEHLQTAPYPTRALQENLTDLRAALASLRSGEQALLRLVSRYGLPKVQHYMEALQVHARKVLHQRLQVLPQTPLLATESMDDGHQIKLAIHWDGDQLKVDFTGSSPVHPGNFNANQSIVYSALIYVLRLLAKDDLPLNEGLLRDVVLVLPNNTFLHPDFVDDPALCPAVVGGNTEVSQRLVDTLLKALGLAAASQGTMNNFLFGNDDFGYYETIGGGTGAGPGFHGRSGIHQHMTNTRITDPEDLERAYPVRLRRFFLRRGSEGGGRFMGGAGLVREVEALVPLSVTLLTQRRKSGPYGLQGGQAGQAGKQAVQRLDGTTEALAGVAAVQLKPGESITIETPGGGGWGKGMLR